MSQDYAILDPDDDLTHVVGSMADGMDALRSDFSGGTPPASPTPVVGQRWRDSDSGWTYQFDGTNWKAISAPDVELDVSEQATTGTSQQVLKSKDVPANYLSVNGQGFEVEARYRTSATANNKRALIKMEGITLIDTGLIALNAGYIWLRARVFRLAAGSQICMAEKWCSNAGLLVPAFTSSDGTEDETTAITIELRGETPTVLGDLTCEFFAIRPIIGGSIAP
jgi:hypothetical protein